MGSFLRQSGRTGEDWWSDCKVMRIIAVGDLRGTERYSGVRVLHVEGLKAQTGSQRGWFTERIEAATLI